jgi:hypothetical protein
LLNNETIEYSDIALTDPVAGKDIVGSIKIFQDVDPSSGKRFSNRLVYCMAVRWKGAAVADASTIAGGWYTLDSDYSLTNVSTLSAAADIANGKQVGILDEYLTGNLRTNDIVWLVVNGPSTSKKGATVVIPAASGIEVASGLGVILSTTANRVGQCIQTLAGYGYGLFTAVGTASNGSANVTLTAADSRIAVGQPVTGTSVPAGTYVSSISGTALVLSANASAAISGGTLTIGGPLRTDTSFRCLVQTQVI